MACGVQVNFHTAIGKAPKVAKTDTGEYLM